MLTQAIVLAPTVVIASTESIAGMHAAACKAVANVRLAPLAWFPAWPSGMLT